MKNRARLTRRRSGIAAAAILWFSVGLAPAAQDTLAIDAPTPVEQALIEQRCGAARTAITADTDAYHNCLTNELQSIRSDFGRDLNKLSPAERRAMDATCNKVRNREGRDAYVACLSGQLATLHARRNPAPAAPSAASASAAPTSAAPQPPDLQALAQAVASTPPPANGSTVLLTAASIAAVFAIGGAAFFFMRRPRRASTCRTCGVTVPGGGDLCQTCRHEAAETLRRAHLDQAEQDQREKEQIARQHAQEEAWRLEQARQAELARRQQIECAQREEQARREEEERRRDEEARERSQFGVDAVFDPYAVLGVPPDASRESIESAYEQAKSKYDADQVAHLSAEVQEHFKQKALAVERAYQVLTAAV